MSGIFGCIDTGNNPENVANNVFYGIFSIQHRGQESSGIAVNNNGSFMIHKNNGLVTEVFDEMTLSALSGSCAIGHVRSGSPRDTGADAIQPHSIKSRVGNIALAADSVILNDNQIRDRLKNNGAIFQTNTDNEIILSLFSRNRVASESCEEAILKTMKDINGVYSMIFMTDNKMIGVRDPWGMRPLVIGKKGEQYFISSESCALDAIDAEFIRDVEPGEVVSISKSGILSAYYSEDKSRVSDGKVCIFEYVYVARPDSTIDGMEVYQSRYMVGKALAKEQPCDCDIVIGAPDSGNTAALGYADALGIPYGAGLLKNRYVGRTFIKSTQGQREMAVKMKFSVLKSAIKGKRVCIVDDSLVRGTTTKHIIKFMRENGASEVHMRLASPQVKFPCCYGVNAEKESDLPAASMTDKEICELIGADSLGYISLESLKSSLTGICCGTCSACFDGNFCAGKPEAFDTGVHKISYN